VTRRFLASRGGRAALALLALALAIRVMVVVLTPDYVLRADPIDYERHAKAIAHDGRYPPPNPALDGASAYRPPAYPYFLAAIYKATPGDSRDWARIAQAILGTVTVGLIGLIAWQLLGGRAGLAATGLGAVYPALWMTGSALLSEVLLTPVALGAVAAALRYRADRRLRWMVLAGVLAGLAILTRQNAALILIPLAMAAVPPRGARGSPRAYGAVVAVLLTATLTVAPWTIRNAIVLDEFVPVSTQDGYTIAGTYNDVAREQERWPAAWVEWFNVPENRAAIREVPNTEVEWGNALRERAVEYARDHPGYVLEVAWWNLRRDFDAAGRDWVEFDIQITATQGLVDVELASFWALALLAAAGALAGALRRAPLWFWLVPLSLMTTVFVVGYLRFRAPVDPFIVILAAAGAVAIWGRIARRRAVIGSGS
jgi:4-amino-4-deoxy-L-arabinose transferase-like glycosyltransferase